MYTRFKNPPAPPACLAPVIAAVSARWGVTLAKGAPNA